MSHNCTESERWQKFTMFIHGTWRMRHLNYGQTCVALCRRQIRKCCWCGYKHHPYRFLLHCWLNRSARLFLKNCNSPWLCALETRHQYMVIAGLQERCMELLRRTQCLRKVNPSFGGSVCDILPSLRVEKSVTALLV